MAQFPEVIEKRPGAGIDGHFARIGGRASSQVNLRASAAGLPEREHEIRPVAKSDVVGHQGSGVAVVVPAKKIAEKGLGSQIKAKVTVVGHAAASPIEHA